MRWEGGLIYWDFHILWPCTYGLFAMGHEAAAIDESSAMSCRSKQQHRLDDTSNRDQQDSGNKPWISGAELQDGHFLEQWAPSGERMRRKGAKKKS